jgi:hypothetical protein
MWYFGTESSSFDINVIQRRLDSSPQSIMGIERLIPRVASLTVDCRGVNISLTKPIWKLSNDKSVRLRYLWKETACCCCIVAKWMYKHSPNRLSNILWM